MEEDLETVLQSAKRLLNTHPSGQLDEVESLVFWVHK
jgi:hypothetical protein